MTPETAAEGTTPAATLRRRGAVGMTRATNTLSRALRLGSGTVAGGRIGLAVDPSLLRSLSMGRATALVTGTNGKTTTTRLLVAALASAGAPVVSNSTGANMPAGHVAALAEAAPDAPAVLEVDEAYLGKLLAESRPVVVVLLNLSRDQLDRTNEVRMLASRWRDALSAAVDAVVVANADDPLVVWSAIAAPRVVWVAAGAEWHLDAVGCPSCGGRIVFGVGPEEGWHCSTCELRRPTPAVRIEWPADVHVGGSPARRSPTEGSSAGGSPERRSPDGASTVVLADGHRVPVSMTLPGRFNTANAVMAAVAAEAFGLQAEASLAAMVAVAGVAGRFTVQQVGGVPTRLLLAKNPAGWAELLRLVRQGADPVVVAINARVADGRDPSWLWDVPFEQLAGRLVVASGERSRDLSVRLHYAGVPHLTVADPVAAIAAAAQAVADDPTVGQAKGAWSGAVELIGNYTAFHDVLGRAEPGPHRRAADDPPRPSARVAR